MQLTTLERPMAVEQLIFRVKPEMVEKFIELDHDIWTLTLSKYPGFISKEVWKNSSNPELVQTIIYWSSMDLWKAIDHNELIATDKIFGEKIGTENFELIHALHEDNQYYKVTEYK